MFKTNESATDRTIRVVLGLAIVSLVFLGPKTSWGWLGLIPVATGLMGWCPLYSLLGFSTCEQKPAK